MSLRRIATAAAPAVLIALMLGALGWLPLEGARVARGAASTAPNVTLQVPPTTQDTCTCLRGTVTVGAASTASTGRTITSVQFDVSPAGADSWTPIGTSTSEPYSVDWDTTTLTPGSYDVRAVATDSTGETGSAIVRDNVVANNATYVALTDPRPVLHGNIELSAVPEDGGNFPTHATFERSPAGAENWTEIGTADPELDGDGFQTGRFVLPVDTSTLSDGSYDLRVSAVDDFGNLFVSRPARARVVDNTPPTATMSDPGGPLQGVVTLSTSAHDATSGVAGVTFERAPAGSHHWSSIGSDTTPPYERSLDTRLLENGQYDFRVEATDRAGNRAASAVVGGVAVANSARTRFDQLAIENLVAPATNISLLGQIAGNAQHETWAFGLTSAPPAVVDGQPLPYTVPGENQLVLLRYTDASGWQIADVLRKADGSAFQQISRATVAAAGAMTPSGEGWIALSQAQTGKPIQTAVFHRVPGGQFVLDPVATATLRPLMSGVRGLAGGELRIGATADGKPYGVLRVPSQSTHTRSVTPPGGGSAVNILTQLDYGVLTDGTWTTNTAGLPAGFDPRPNELVSLRGLDPTGPGTGWGVLSRSTTVVPRPLMLGRFDGGGWQFVTTKLDALDLTDDFSLKPLLDVESQQQAGTVRADSGGVWVAGTVSPALHDNGVVARYDSGSDQVTAAWCGDGLPRASVGCGGSLDADHPAAVPDQVFDMPEGKVGLALRNDSIGIYAHGDWTSVAAPGFRPGVGKALFTAPNEGWLVGANAIGRVGGKAAPDQLAAWPQANRSPLLSVALPPGSAAGVGESGALAVGLDGTALRYDSAAGWLVEPTPSRARHVALRSVAFAGPSSAFAVGALGTILRWDGTTWSEDPQSVSITQSQLNSVAFRADGQGWAVGALGTILHFDGQSWSKEPVPADDEVANITSVAVAGRDVFAVAGGNLITRGADGAWHAVADADLPSPAPVAGNLRLVAGLPDGGAVVAGRSVVMVRPNASSPFEYSPQPVEGIGVALAAFRDDAGKVRAFVSLAPPVFDANGVNTHEVGGFPPGDGDLLRETANGWQDVGRDQYPGSSAFGDGAVKPDPVLAVAANAAGTSAWAVGGYAGTVTAARLGTDVILPARPAGWRTAAIWRYDTGGSVASPALAPGDVSLPAKPNTVSFAFFSAALCRSQCAAVRDAQPDVNVRAAASEIAAFAGQPGGPAFALLGGNARGPIDDSAYSAGNGAVDLAHLPDLLAPLGDLPVFAAYGPRDAVPTSSDPAAPWGDAFAQARPPFGRGAPAAGITPAGEGGSSGSVNRYYAFDVGQNGGRMRMIVLDDSAGSLDGTFAGQAAWLDSQLADANASGLPVVAAIARPLRSSVFGADSDADALAAKLASAGVLAVFTTSGSNLRSQVNRRAMVPENADPSAQIPEYEGATLGYQQSQNNGVLWYSVAVDTAARSVDVSAIPVVSSLAIKPLAGLTVARSSTLQFEAVGRRPVGTIATPPTDDSFPGFDNYVGIPAANCSGCIGPSYKFKSSDPTIGDFVVPSGPGSRYPKLDSKGKPTASSASGLFCAFNSGETTISVTSGLLSSSLPVTVEPGDIGRPCGTVFRAGVQRVIVVPNSHQVSRTTSPGGAATPPPPPAAAPVNNVLPKLALRVPPPPRLAPKPAAHARPAAKAAAPAAAPPPAPAPLPPAPVAPPLSPLITVPPVPPTAQPIPPGGAAGASSPSAARRKEKVHKHAQQSAYVTRPAGVSGADWFFPAVGAVGLLAMMLAAGGVKRDPRPRPAPVLLREQRAPTSRKDRWQ